MGKIDSPQIKLLNRIEEMWYNNRPTGDAWIPCDQVIMSVVFDKNIIQQSHTYEVRLSLPLIHGYTIITPNAQLS